MAPRTRPAASVPTAPNPVYPTLKDQMWLVAGLSGDKRLLVPRVCMGAKGSGPSIVSGAGVELVTPSPSSDSSVKEARAWFSPAHLNRTCHIRKGRKGPRFGLWPLHGKPFNQRFSPLPNSNTFALPCQQLLKLLLGVSEVHFSERSVTFRALACPRGPAALPSTEGA